MAGGQGLSLTRARQKHSNCAKIVPGGGQVAEIVPITVLQICGPEGPTHLITCVIAQSRPPDHLRIQYLHNFSIFSFIYFLAYLGEWTALTWPTRGSGQP